MVATGPPRNRRPTNRSSPLRILLDGLVRRVIDPSAAGAGWMIRTTGIVTMIVQVGLLATGHGGENAMHILLCSFDLIFLGVVLITPADKDEGVRIHLGHCFRVILITTLVLNLSTVSTVIHEFRDDPSSVAVDVQDAATPGAATPGAATPRQRDPKDLRLPVTPIS